MAEPGFMTASGVPAAGDHACLGARSHTRMRTDPVVPGRRPRQDGRRPLAVPMAGLVLQRCLF